MTNFFVWTGILVLVSLFACPCYTGTSRDQSKSKKQPIGAVLCQDGLASCPVHSSTCCLGKSNRYFCCPLPNAVCCSDGIHCCPQCFSCNVKGNSCTRPAADAAAVRIFSLVPHIDKRIHTPPPTPPAAAAVAAAAKQREFEDNKAAALAAAIARKKAAEESEGFVSGVLSAVKLTLFSSDDGPAGRKAPLKAAPGLVGHGTKSPINIPVSKQSLLNKPPKLSTLQASNTAHQIRSQSVGISKSSGIMAQAAAHPTIGGKFQQKKSPQTTPSAVHKQPNMAAHKPNVGGAVGGAKKTQTKSVPSEAGSQEKEDKEPQNSGFFSSVFSAVTDFYSGGSKEEAKPADVKKPVAGGQHQKSQQQQQQQLQQQLKQQQQFRQQQQQQLQQNRPVQSHGKMIPQTAFAGKPHQTIPKQMQQQQRTLAQKQPIRTPVPVANQQAKKTVPQSGSHKISGAQVNFRQSTVQGKPSGQGGFKQVPAHLQQLQQQKQQQKLLQQQGARQGVGVSQKSAAAAIAAQQKKAKAWEAKKL